MTSILFAVSMIGLYFFWYTKLPPAEEKNDVTISFDARAGSK
jgi:hypothetical protein